MIAINPLNIIEIAQTHYQAIRNYLANDKKDKKKLDKINQNIKTHFGEAYNLEKIILATPRELKELAIEENKNKSVFKENYYNYLSSNKFYTIDNQYYRGSNIIESLGIRVCPYCNRNFIYNLNKKRATYQLDHFYSQTHFPFLALSFFNLIPSCVTCNGLLEKKDKEVKVNPYDEMFPFEKIRFELKILKPDFYYNKDSFDIVFDLSHLNPQQQADFQTNIDIFHLELHYKTHKSYVLQLIQRNLTYSEAYIQELYEKFGGTVFENKEQITGFINENIDKNFYLRPLSKLTHDIAKELGLI
ncbi:MAG: hypothetical protein MUF43_07795 [Flavobacterium sp.]|jgi:hypothetical protein|nr:hypothetical protein [Flavobacterium sp.]MCU0392922.1 hypothetical protein [Thermoflexibacter sp.]